MPAPERNWFPLSWCLSSHDWLEYTKSTWPHVYVHAKAVKNNPEKVGPMGTRASIGFEYESSDVTFRVRLFEEWSPWLTPDAVEAYLYIHWPEYFRRGSNGQAPE
jgi:hypothetical protein